MKQALRYLAISRIAQYFIGIGYLLFLLIMDSEKYIAIGALAILIIGVSLAGAVFDWLFILRAIKK